MVIGKRARNWQAKIFNNLRWGIEGRAEDINSPTQNKDELSKTAEGRWGGGGGVEGAGAGAGAKVVTRISLPPPKRKYLLFFNTN